MYLFVGSTIGFHPNFRAYIGTDSQYIILYYFIQVALMFHAGFYTSFGTDNHTDSDYYKYCFIQMALMFNADFCTDCAIVFVA